MRRRSFLKLSILSSKLYCVLFTVSYLTLTSIVIQAAEIVDGEVDIGAQQDKQIIVNSNDSDSEVKSKNLGFELNGGMATLQPEIFFDSNLNKSAKLTGGVFGIVKQFRLTSSLLTNSNLRLGYFSGSLSSVDVNLERDFSFITVQMVQQFALQIDSWELDDAQVQPLIGVGGFWGSLTDNFNHEEFVGVNRLTDFGAVVEAGVMFVSERTGFFTTLKGQALFSFLSQYDGSSDDAETLEFLEAPTLASKMPILVLLGFGVFY